MIQAPCNLCDIKLKIPLSTHAQCLNALMSRLHLDPFSFLTLRPPCCVHCSNLPNKYLWTVSYLLLQIQSYLGSYGLMFWHYHSDQHLYGDQRIHLAKLIHELWSINNNRRAKEDRQRERESNSRAVTVVIEWPDFPMNWGCRGSTRLYSMLWCPRNVTGRHGCDNRTREQKNGC